ncbi:TonB-dependent receptor plug domain-containing protein [Acanthopleuribacter pedis]|uniref:TonB-dependent receptor n=1 Tax=Acanthopleuribacter pedis TaxID=442870 RepID=A0A8J7QBY2_9BACT|nr:TonB-dependent receptor [Acanthopleuribacter pedis]MBO1321294.1 TonB-dependent receptor [Acanthopleuribacter pedis]
MTHGRLNQALLFALVGFALISFSAPVLAQEETSSKEQENKEEKKEEENTLYEALVVTGSRAKPRSATESMVPIDVLQVGDIANSGETDITNQLRNLVPSFNVNAQPISDAATVVRPANLRGLAPDHTLVLVNGKRRHRAAVIYWLGNGVADGAQGPDISAIPSIALRQVEVLRDGASAQYGSDAIAGVMNFMLKEDREGATLEVRNGSYQEGDGDTITFSGNVGLPWGELGFLNLSFEYGQTDPTNRSVQRDDAAGLIAAGNTAVANPAQIWGSPEIEDDLKLWANWGYTFDNGSKFYGHANYVSKTVTGGFYFRNPNTRSAVYSADGGQTLLVGDLIDARDGVLDGSADCPTVPIVNGVPDPTALAEVFANPDCWTFQELFPGGFTPSFGGDVVDNAINTGIRGTTEDGLYWDASVSYGANEVDFFIFNTVNASLGPDSPTSFDPGLYKQEEISFNFDTSYALSERANIAAGAEYREETFEIGLGQAESYAIGGLANQGFSAASNGFPGFSPLAAGSWDRGNFAFYADLELTGEKWTAGVATRFEDFDDFGTTMNSKFAFNYRFNEAFATRGSVSSGFRAPTPGQSNAFNVSTEFDIAAGELVNNGTIPSSSAVARLRGGEPLVAEKSINYTVGTIFKLGEINVTLDYFNIELKDRLAVTQLFALTPQEVEDLLAEGVTSAANLQNFRFFTNDFETKTEGFDLVATYRPEALGGDTDFSLVFNQTETSVEEFNPDTLDATRIRELQEGLPEIRWNLAANHRMGNFRVLGRLSYFDDWFDSEDVQVYGGEYLVDAELAYTWDERLGITIGGQNIFDTFPEENPGARSGVGNLYSQFTPFGFNGGFYYVRLRYDF